MLRRVPASAAIVLAAALVASLAGCSTSSSDASADDAPPTRTITDVAGRQEIPTNPKRIIAVDENAALNLLSIGITPTVAFDSWNTTVPANVIKAAGVQVEHVGGSTAFPSLEKVAAEKPDLIVATQSEGQGIKLPKYGQVAPTVHALYTASWQDVVSAYGEYFDRKAQADKVMDALEQDTADIKASQPSPPMSVSVLMSYAQQNLILSMDSSNTISTLIADAGFTRPESAAAKVDASQSYGGWSQLSPENLAEHDADVVAITSGTNYDPKTITDLAVFPTLAASKAGKTPTVDGDFWSGGYGFSTYWVLQDLKGFLAGDDTAGDASDARARWKAFEKEIGQS
ncbi:ABC transporter substrate-binding protein [Curtobacterium sp. 18060]|uniref:ABC transporter substrate-binding protein n=1 Tax=Curtobacterium sp. 18060 TaxID=2681408 RepID=UPI001357673A|nr:ABC transporter substrate-binding protein [Curtobacterium sp. 18060]